MPLEPYFDKHGFLTLTDQAITIQGEEGWKYLSIENDDDSSADLIITGNAGETMGGQACGNIPLKAGKAITLGTGITAIDNVTLTAPTGCTVYISGVKLRNIP